MTERTTKYITAVREIVQQKGHVTNTGILVALQKLHPNVSATTVHRITSRLVERGEIAIAPPAHDNSTRFDAVPRQHDHFSCNECGCLRDVHLPPEVIGHMNDLLSDCTLTGPLTIQGICHNCSNQFKFKE